MKRHLLLICLFGVMPLAPWSQSCDLPEIFYEAYERDVKHLALIEMEKAGAAGLDSIEIPQSWQQPLWNGFGAIYNSISPERDTVFDIYCIHHLSWTSENYMRIQTEMYVEIAPSAPWHADWVNGTIATNDSFIDSLFQKYGIYRIDHFQLLDAFTVYTDQYLNLDAFARVLETHDDIISASAKPYAGDNGRVIYEGSQTQGRFDFSLGWGDCTAGCIFRRTWSFDVDIVDCRVLTATSNGATQGLPPPVNCDLSSALAPAKRAMSHVQLYPNPVADQLEVVLADRRSCTYELLDVSGEIQLMGTLTGRDIINCSGFAPGLYLIVVRCDSQVPGIYKIMKL